MDGRGYLALLGLALQFGLQPFFSKRFIAPEVRKVAVVLLTEGTKVVLCGVCLVAEGLLEKERFANLRAIGRQWTLRGSLYCAAVPAVLYSAQNMLVQNGYRYLDALTFNLLNQCKTIFAALCLYLVLGKGQSGPQMLALLLLVTAACLLNFGATPDANGKDAELSHEEWLRLGFMPVLLASFISGFTTAFTQKVLTERRNSYLFSMELAIMGMVALLGNFFSGEEGRKLLETGDYGGLFVGVDAAIVLPVTLNAAGGIIVGLVVKYAGGVRKGFALVLGILITGVLQAIVEGTPVTPMQGIAAGLVVVAVYLHTNFPVKPKTSAADEGSRAPSATNAAEKEPAAASMSRAARPISSSRRRTRRD